MLTIMITDDDLSNIQKAWLDLDAAVVDKNVEVRLNRILCARNRLERVLFNAKDMTWEERMEMRKKY